LRGKIWWCLIPTSSTVYSLGFWHCSDRSRMSSQIHYPEDYHWSSLTFLSLWPKPLLSSLPQKVQLEGPLLSQVFSVTSVRAQCNGLSHEGQQEFQLLTYWSNNNSCLYLWTVPIHITTKINRAPM
jgi:hypothetical protein